MEQRAEATISCLVCQRPCGPGERSRGRCLRCYLYWYRHGQERPRDDLLGAATVAPCTHCARPVQRRIRGQCVACYMYWWRHHTERPSSFWTPPTLCPSCQCPLASPRRRGICGSCYMRAYRQNPTRHQPCQVCGKATLLVRGRC